MTHVVARICNINLVVLWLYIVVSSDFSYEIIDHTCSVATHTYGMTVILVVLRQLNDRHNMFMFLLIAGL